MTSPLVSTLLVPILYIGSALAFLLSPATTLASYIGSFAWRCASLPARVLTQFETFYMFCGSAAVVGIIAGAVFAVGDVALFSILGLNMPSQPPAPMGAAISSSRRGSSRWHGHLDAETNGSLTKQAADSRDDDGSLFRSNYDLGLHDEGTEGGGKGHQPSSLSSPSSSTSPFLWRSNPPAAAPQHSSVVHTSSPSSSHHQKEMFPILEEEDELEDGEGLSASQLRRQNIRLALSSPSTAPSKERKVFQKKDR